MKHTFADHNPFLRAALILAAVSLLVGLSAFAYLGTFTRYGADDYCKCPIGGVYGLHFRVAGPALVQLHTPTQGASLAYRLGDDPVWRLYTGAFPLGKGEWQLSAKAARIGFKESAERAFVLTIS